MPKVTRYLEPTADFRFLCDSPYSRFRLPLWF